MITLFLITMASSRIDRLFVHMTYMGTDISLGDSVLYEWELYANMVVYWSYLHAYFGVPA